MATRVNSAVAGAVLKRVFGIQAKNLSDRNVSPINAAAKTLEYDLDEVVSGCYDLIFNNISKKYGTDDTDLAEMKKQKLIEEIRKLKIENDAKEAVLVPASDVMETYTKGIRALCDVLDSLPSRVKMENPDILPSALDSINRCLAELRNAAADSIGVVENSKFGQRDVLPHGNTRH